MATRAQAPAPCDAAFLSRDESETRSAICFGPAFCLSVRLSVAPWYCRPIETAKPVVMQPLLFADFSFCYISDFCEIPTESFAAELSMKCNCRQLMSRYTVQLYISNRMTYRPAVGCLTLAGNK